MTDRLEFRPQLDEYIIKCIFITSGENFDNDYLKIKRILLLLANTILSENEIQFNNLNYFQQARVIAELNRYLRENFQPILNKSNITAEISFDIVMLSVDDLVNED